jgi:uncharacterized protein involved in high-affinity Fe2+ transport
MIAGCAAHNHVAEEAQPAAEPEVVRVIPPMIPVEITTAAVMPLSDSSDEATPAQLARASDEGKAVQHELEWVEREEAAASGDIAAGEYVVTYLITPADDYYDLEAAKPDQPAHHTTVLPGSAHVAVVVRDAADGRIVQDLGIRATLSSEDEHVQKAVDLPYGWHPILNRYGENVILPASSFTLTIHIAMPAYRRHDGTNGDRFKNDVVAEFAHVTVSRDSLASMAQRLARGDQRQAVAIARQEGTATDRPIAALLRGANTSGSQLSSGDYKVAVIVQPARGYWEARNGKLSYVDSNNNVGSVVHMDVIIRDATTGRLLPGLNVRATVLNSRKKEIGTYAMPFMWHPWMNHYGLDVAVPENGRYTIRVRADAPAFRRYGSTALRKFNRVIDAEFRNVRLATPKK